MRASKSTDLVREYYRENQILYTLFWTERQALSMNVGLWTRGTRTRVQALENQNAFIGEALRPEPSDVLLEAGCGTGGTSIWLARRFGSRVHGITLCDRQGATAARYARAREVSDRVTFSVMDFTATAFQDGSFSGVFASESVCHAERKEAFVAEAFRLLRSGGRLVVVDGFLNSRELSERDRQLYVDWCDGWAIPNLSTVDEFSGMLQGSGFQYVDFQDLTEVIRPSSRRVFAWGCVGFPILRLLCLCGVASRRQLGHALGCLRMHALVTRGVCRFGAFAARKP